MPDSNDSLPSLGKLQGQIDEAKRRQAEKEPKSDEPVSPGDAMRMGLELVAGVGVGSTFGYFIDRWLGTMPLFFIVCFFLGAAAGFRNMIREASGKKEKE
jgi:ATP synthase protein I